VGEVFLSFTRPVIYVIEIAIILISFQQQKGETLSEEILFPSMINKLPDIDIPLPGIEGKLFQGQGMQAVFFTVPGPAEIPPHHHQAQWGVMLDGEAELTVDGKPLALHRGVSYYIPAGAVHSVRVLTFMKALDFFDEPNRYKIKL
jgi:mannose-6-phosphate isomerase-like protein (cupin superfamily)